MPPLPLPKMNVDGVRCGRWEMDFTNVMRGTDLRVGQLSTAFTSQVIAGPPIGR